MIAAFSYPKPISVARCVMEKCKHSMLVGGGANSFARSMGFVLESNDSLLTDETRLAYEKFKITHSVDQAAHDTLCKNQLTHCRILCVLGYLYLDQPSFQNINCVLVN